jgi:hypothetical protein
MTPVADAIQADQVAGHGEPGDMGTPGRIKPDGLEHPGAHDKQAFQPLETLDQDAAAPHANCSRSIKSSSRRWII